MPLARGHVPHHAAPAGALGKGGLGACRLWNTHTHNVSGVVVASTHSLFRSHQRPGCAGVPLAWARGSWPKGVSQVTQ